MRGSIHTHYAPGILADYGHQAINIFWKSHDDIAVIIIISVLWTDEMLYTYSNAEGVCGWKVGVGGETSQSWIYIVDVVCTQAVPFYSHENWQRLWFND